MRVHAFAAAIATSSPFRLRWRGQSCLYDQPAHAARRGKQADAVWKYKAEVDKMTDRTVHYLLAEGKGRHWGVVRTGAEMRWWAAVPSGPSGYT